MFRHVRFRLTLLYLVAGAGLVIAVAWSAYGLVSFFFHQSTDRALQHVMAEHMTLLGEPLPAELLQAERAWYSGSGMLPLQVSEALIPYIRDLEGDGDEIPQERHETATEQSLDAELAAVFVLALNENGRLLPGFNTAAAPMPPELDAVQNALESGKDWRTVQVNGTRIRLLTYRMVGLVEPTFLQVGRSVNDQDRLLTTLTIGLLAIGSISLIGLGGGSWWLAGRSLEPMERAWSRQQSFVANASHELRTPLTLIRSSAEVARRSLPSGSEASGLIDDVLRECDHMSRLIEDQLLLSRLDANRIDLTLQPIAVHRMLAEVARQIRHLPAAEGVNVVDDSEQIWVQGDFTRLRQVLLILLDNALRYTPTGGTITLRASQQGAQANIEVSDSGSGIPAGEVNRVMERFYRVDKARSRAEGGSGLGLSIARALVEAHRGTIELESTVGQGTVVRLHLPAIPRDQASTRPTS
ncbi:MAG: ATP-binding protein [Anaerolineales bacterium]